jgi:glycosyltransferase involved in cell wall biosynthesis
LRSVAPDRPSARSSTRQFAGSGPSALPVIAPVAAGTRPFWSVMIPCYNGADLLAETLQSVLAQDPGPDEMQIEVVDDASTIDDPGEVVRSLGGGRVRYFRQPQNVGPSANFTTCVSRSVGRWVHVLHGDDLVRPGFYEAYRSRIEACPDAVMVGSQTIGVDSEGRETGLTPPVATASGYLLDPAFTMASLNPLRCVSSVVSRTAYEQWGGFHPGLFHANDWEMWVRMASRGPVAWEDEPRGLYRKHERSDTTRLHRSTAFVDDCLDATEAIAAHFDRSDRARVRRAARSSVCEYALIVSRELLTRGEWRLAAANAVKAVRIDRLRDVRVEAWRLGRQALRGRLGR